MRFPIGTAGKVWLDVGITAGKAWRAPILGARHGRHGSDGPNTHGKSRQATQAWLGVDGSTWR